MTERMRHIAGAAVGLLLFALALGLLTHELRHYHLHEVAVALRAISPFRLVVALVLTLLNYLVLSGYDALGLRVVGRPLPYRQTAFASFVSYVIAHNVGASFLGGAAMAARLPPDLRARVALIALLGPSTGVDFQFHLSDWVTDAARATTRPVRPEVEKLRGSSIRDRTRRLIAIAHPKFRDELIRDARAMGFLRD